MSRKKSQDIRLYHAGELLPVGGDLDQLLQGELTRGLLRATRAEVDGRVARVRIQEAGATADLAMDGVAALSAKEARLARELPHAVGRFSAIADAFAFLALDELRSLRQR